MCEIQQKNLVSVRAQKDVGPATFSRYSSSLDLASDCTPAAMSRLGRTLLIMSPPKAEMIDHTVAAVTDRLHVAALTVSPLV